MSTWLSQGVVVLLTGLTAAGALYYLVGALATCRWRQRRPPVPPPNPPPISVLKPLCGAEPGALESFATFCRQEYPCFELLFGAADPADPALAVVSELRRRFPHVPIRIVVTAGQPGANPKAANLAGLAPHARHAVLLISDSDVRVAPDHLLQVAASLAEPNAGVVTSPYRGEGATGAIAALEALGIGAEFLPGAVLAAELGIPAAFGASLAFRRELLERIGGFTGLATFLADDFELARAAGALGLRTVWTSRPVACVVPDEGWERSLGRRLRWMRTSRLCCPSGYAGYFLTLGTLWGLLLVIAAGFAPWAVALLVLQQVVRLTAAAYLLRALDNTRLLRWLWLLPAGDLLSSGLWLAGWTGNSVVWRGVRYRIHRDGRLTRITRETGSGGAEPAPAPLPRR